VRRRVELGGRLQGKWTVIMTHVVFEVGDGPDFSSRVVAAFADHGAALRLADEANGWLHAQSLLVGDRIPPDCKTYMDLRSPFDLGYRGVYGNGGRYVVVESDPIYAERLRQANEMSSFH
jgi:hypothetical protein